MERDERQEEQMKRKLDEVGDEIGDARRKAQDDDERGPRFNQSDQKVAPPG